MSMATMATTITAATATAAAAAAGDDRDQKYDPISFTARKVLQARARYTSIPLAREMAEAAEVPAVSGVRDRFRRLVWGKVRSGLYLQLRHQAISEALRAYPGSAVLELAAGYSTRGLVEAGEREAYVETDLAKMLERKRRLVARMRGGAAGPAGNHYFMPLNVCDPEEMRRVGEAVMGMRLTRPVVVIHEGLLMYLDASEQAAVRDNVAWFLRNCSNGGAWVTTDFSEKCQDVSLVQRVMSLRLRREVKREMNYFADAGAVGAFLSAAGLSYEQRPNLEGGNRDGEVRRIAEGFRAWRVTA